MNIIPAGILLAAYMFVTITAYVFLSGVFVDVITGVENINMSASDALVEASGSTLRIVFDMMFAGLLLVPVVWFVYWAYSREPDWGYRRY